LWKTTSSAVGSQCMVSTIKSVAIQRSKRSVLPRNRFVSVQSVRTKMHCQYQYHTRASARNASQLYQRVRQANQLNIVLLPPTNYFIILYNVVLIVNWASLTFKNNSIDYYIFYYYKLDFLLVFLSSFYAPK